MSFAHYGYVYALHMTIRPDGSRWLISGSGDSDVKIWQCLPGGGLHHLRNFSGLTGAVLSFAVRDSLLFAGLQDGEIVVWDLETGACIRTIEAHDSDVLTMAVLGSEVYTAAADGRVIRVNEEFDATAAFRAHSGIILSSTIVEGTKDGWELITAGNDSYVKVICLVMPHDTEADKWRRSGLSICRSHRTTIQRSQSRARAT
jgi:di- and tripeptidase